MPDYGHDIRLAAFLTPQSRRPLSVVALAQLSEQSGLGLVGSQDHPDQPEFHSSGVRLTERDAPMPAQLNVDV